MYNGPNTPPQITTMPKKKSYSFKHYCKNVGFSWNHSRERERHTNRPAVVLTEDVLDSLCQSEGLAGTVGSNDEDGGQGDGDGRCDGQDGFFLLGIETGVQLFIPLPAGMKRMETWLLDPVDYWKTDHLKTGVWGVGLFYGHIKHGLLGSQRQEFRGVDKFLHSSLPQGINCQFQLLQS